MFLQQLASTRAHRPVHCRHAAERIVLVLQQDVAPVDADDVVLIVIAVGLPDAAGDSLRRDTVQRIVAITPHVQRIRHGRAASRHGAKPISPVIHVISWGRRALDCSQQSARMVLHLLDTAAVFVHGMGADDLPGGIRPLRHHSRTVLPHQPGETAPRVIRQGGLVHPCVAGTGRAQHAVAGRCLIALVRVRQCVAVVPRGGLRCSRLVGTARAAHRIRQPRLHVVVEHPVALVCRH